MQEIELPNGDVLEFPDGMTDDQIRDAIRKNYPGLSRDTANLTSAPAGGFLSDMVAASQTKPPKVGATVDEIPPTYRLKDRGASLTYEDALGRTLRVGNDAPLPPGDYDLSELRGLRVQDVRDPVSGEKPITPGAERREDVLSRIFEAAAARTRQPGDTSGMQLGRVIQGLTNLPRSLGLLPSETVSKPNEQGFLGSLSDILQTTVAGAPYAAGQVGRELGMTQTDARRLARDLDAMALAGSVVTAQPTPRSLAPSGVRTVPREAVSKAAKRVANSLDDLSDPRFKMTVGQKTGSTAIQELENFTVKLPGGPTAFSKQAAANSKRLESAVKRIINRMGGSADDVAVAGQQVKEGVRSFADKTFEIGAKIQRRIAADPAQIVQPGKTLDLLDTRAMGRFEGVLDNPAFRQIRARLSEMDDAPTWGELNALRQRVGKALNSPSPLPEGVDVGELKKLYAALKDDLRGALPPAKQKAWDNYNQFMARRFEMMENARGLIRRGNVEPEKIISALRTSGKGGPTLIRQTMQKLSLPERDVLRASILDDMMDAARVDDLADGAEVSLAKFLSEWRKMNPSAQRSLFGKNYTRALNKITNDLAKLKQASRIGENPSGSGMTGAQLGTYGALISGLATMNPYVTGAAGGTIALGRMGLPLSRGILQGAQAAGGAGQAVWKTLLRSPRFVQWLAEGSRPATNLTAHINRLGQIAKEMDPETRDAVRAYLEAIGGGNESQR